MSDEYHTHSHQSLKLTIVLNVIITGAQFAGGLISGSLALISDAVHNLSDSVAVFLAYLASVIGRREKTAQSTFGYKRAEILAAFLNALVLAGISLFLLFEAIERFFNPKEIDFRWMLGLGLVGLVANSLSVLILHKDKKENLNIQAAYLHLLGDALTSLAVIVGAFFIWMWNWHWIDPLVTVLISLYLLFHTYSLLKESTGILMQFAPASVPLQELERNLNTIAGVKRVYHIHIWQLTDQTIHFEAHVELSADLRLSETRQINERVNTMLHDQYGISHVTLQFEFNCDSSQVC